jgi:hypothetical protein
VARWQVGGGTNPRDKDHVSVARDGVSGGLKLPAAFVHERWTLLGVMVINCGLVGAAYCGLI